MKKSFALSLAAIMRFKATRKWPIRGRFILFGVGEGTVGGGVEMDEGREVSTSVACVAIGSWKAVASINIGV